METHEERAKAVEVFRPKLGLNVPSFTAEVSEYSGEYLADVCRFRMDAHPEMTRSKEFAGKRLCSAIEEQVAVSTRWRA